MNQSSQLTLQDYWAIALRRKWLIIASVVICVVGAWALCKVLPKSYRSSTLILVEGQRIPERYVQGVVTGTVQERLTLIQQQVMSRTLLNGVINEFNLYPEQVEQGQIERVIDEMRKDIEVEIKGSRRGQVDAFTISFAHEQPEVARRVTTKLASTFIEQNLRMREEFVEGASEFLDQELAAAKAELENQERSISEFKRNHMGELPEQTEANLRALDRLQKELIALDESGRVLSDRLATIEKAALDYQATGEAALGLANNAGGTLDRLRRLRELEQKLSKLSAEYKETYPDIILIRKEIEQVKRQIADEHGDQEGAHATQPFDPYLSDLHKQREKLRTELGSLRRQREQLERQKAAFENRVERAPTVEQKLLILERDYENRKENYQSLLKKRLSARIAENLERRQQSEQFRVVDPANLPREPERPNRMRIMLLGFLAGCGLGLGGSLALDVLLFPAFRRPEELEAALGVPVLAAIPNIWMAYAGKPGRWRWGRHTASVPDLTLPPPDDVSGAGDMLELGERKGQAPRGQPSCKSLPPELSLVTRWRPHSVIAEQFRVAATRLAFMEGGNDGAVVVFTSAVKGEGKSTTTANLAYILAKDMEKPTLLVDSDVKCAMAHAYCGVSPSPGLAEFLNGKEPLDSCLHQVGRVPLWVLPMGDTTKHPVELGKVHRLGTVLGELRARFNYVLLDAPPILAVADIHVLVRLANKVVFVVRAGETSQHVALKALEKLVHNMPTGAILSGVDTVSMPYYMQPGYYASYAQSHRLPVGQ